jgi:hypothetical protein
MSSRPPPSNPSAPSDAAFEAWKKVTANRADATRAAMSESDWAKQKIAPKDMAVELGPLLTEEQFQAYCRTNGIKPQILKTKQ